MAAPFCRLSGWFISPACISLLLPFSCGLIESLLLLSPLFSFLYLHAFAAQGIWASVISMEGPLFRLSYISTHLYIYIYILYACVVLWGVHIRWLFDHMSAVAIKNQPLMPTRIHHLSFSVICRWGRVRVFSEYGIYIFRRGLTTGRSACLHERMLEFMRASTRAWSALKTWDTHLNACMHADAKCISINACMQAFNAYGRAYLLADVEYARTHACIYAFTACICARMHTCKECGFPLLDFTRV